ncbi:hypothetical protein P691DRAFT_762572 [Macrolepiota fuliginosa MF-IS2]|uniref:Uncharacterized protein n=1 Tax=Macrolepiota fuliginosa MF-IS2 TaxID=1400762 RepID=A0A9P5X6G1_9AGAR|nr:hypothetical protein P691DRAFT_762572 [Macrolepiota fuliginosa MF-IS2]
MKMQATGHPAVHAFVGLQLFGAIGFLFIVLLAEIVDRENVRHPTWRGFCVAWVVFGVSYAMLSLAGMQFSQNPNHIFCTIQSALVYAASPLVAHAALALVTQLASVVLHVLQKTNRPLSRTMQILIAVAPWLLWLINVFSILLYAIHKPDLVSMNKNGTYCHLSYPTMSKIMASWLSVVATAAVGIEIILLYRRGFLLSRQCDVSRSIMRLGIFLVQAIICIGVAIAFIATNHRAIVFDILIAIQPSLAAIIFGTNPSLLHIWSWKRRAPRGGIITHASADLSAVTTSGNVDA